jgi:hypothetical protein
MNSWIFSRKPASNTIRAIWIERVVPGCVLRTTRGYRLPSLRDVRGEGGGARGAGAWVSVPLGGLHAGGVGAGSPGCEATPGHAWERMNNPGGVEGSGAFAPLPGCVFVIMRVVPGCVLRTTRGYRLPSLRDEGGGGGVARGVEFVGSHPSGIKEAREVSHVGWSPLPPIPSGRKTRSVRRVSGACVGSHPSGMRSRRRCWSV